jgi:hypothetical protein
MAPSVDFRETGARRKCHGCSRDDRQVKLSSITSHSCELPTCNHCPPGSSYSQLGRLLGPIFYNHRPAQQNQNRPVPCCTRTPPQRSGSPRAPLDDTRPPHTYTPEVGATRMHVPGAAPRRGTTHVRHTRPHAANPVAAAAPCTTTPPHPGPSRSLPLALPVDPGHQLRARLHEHVPTTATPPSPP